MAVYKIFPEKTATLYSQYPDVNTGKDEILELASYYVGDANYVKRFLIQFNTTEIRNVIDTYLIPESGAPTGLTASLNLYLASANEVPVEYAVEAYPTYVGNAGSWTAGNGKYGDIPANSSGVSWKYINYSGSTQWGTTTNVTQSYSGSNTGGGAWYTGSAGANFSSKQVHGVNSTHDISLDVSTAVLSFYTSSNSPVSLTNAGFLVKLTGSLEFNAYTEQRQLYLRYFSGNTHTIYPPCLEIKWIDVVTTGNANISTTSDISPIVSIRNRKDTYTDEGVEVFQLITRPKYPVRTFSTASNYLTNYYLPLTSCWGLRDENTEEMVIDFDSNYTKLGRDSIGNYFKVHMGGLEPERYYRLLIKVIFTDYTNRTSIIDTGQVFKVVRNV